VVQVSIASESQEAADLIPAAATNASPQTTARTRVVQNRSPARGLQDLAEQEGADAIVLGSTHRGALGRVLVGSVAERLLTSAPCAVAVAPRGYREKGAADPPRVVAVGFDGGPESRRALAQASEIAEACGATLRVVAVQEPEGLTQRDHLEKDMRNAVEALPSGLRAQGVVRRGKAAEVLAKEAEKGVDLLVVGSRSHGPLLKTMLGGVSTSLVRSSTCPVLVVPRSADSGNST
jgi:nucleotide-binding universal stress UspA family protein